MRAILPSLAALALLAGPASAQRHHNYGEEDAPAIALSPLDCSELSGSPLICVRNPTHASVVGISCTGFWGTTAMSVPGGMIPSSGSAVVRFAGKCEKVIHITLRGGNAFDINGFDITKNAVLIIPEQ